MSLLRLNSKIPSTVWVHKLIYGDFKKINYALQRLCFDCILPELKKVKNDHNVKNDQMTKMLNILNMLNMYSMYFLTKLV